MKRAVYILLILLLLSASCSNKDGEEESIVTKDSYPDIIMENTRAQIGQDAGSPIILEAEKMTLYSSDGTAELENFSFTSYTSDGRIETEGKAKRGLVELDGSKVELSGLVTFSRPDDNMFITADNLIYNKNNDEISASGHVKVDSKEGTIEGEDFKGDLKSKTYSFSSIEKGDFDLE